MSENLKFKPLEVIGLISVLISIVIGSIDLYDRFAEDVIAEGTVSSYQSPPFLLNGYRNSKAYFTTLKTIARDKKIVSQKEIDSLIKDSEIRSRTSFNIDDTMSLIVSRGNDYRSFWVFTIKNDSDKPLEDLVLLTDLNGFCKTDYPFKKSSFHSFSSSIKLGELNPSYEIIVICWSDDNYNNNFLDYKKIRLTHKNGSVDVSFPNEKGKFMRTLSSIPIYIYAVVTILLIILIFKFSKKSLSSNNENSLS
ncbi:hypothetical protein GGR22_002052 [Flavobacterium gossypii]|uniref:Uncharacterized protein n=1 Tax=Flavobacterium gossypii TaxID=1646119 RepID=A0ABR6DQC1_9FLAO|nr:hypothetical protein [Flavobacterium gossypii]MBA9073885.1 hypothetical protein [Flavobacterium gossypii]